MTHSLSYFLSIMSLPTCQSTRTNTVPKIAIHYKLKLPKTPTWIGKAEVLIPKNFMIAPRFLIHSKVPGHPKLQLIIFTTFIYYAFSFFIFLGIPLYTPCVLVLRPFFWGIILPFWVSILINHITFKKKEKRKEKKKLPNTPTI